MQKTVLEAAWLYHELGRCCLELGKFPEASSYGEQSLDSATQASDDNWQINSSVLIAQAEGGLLLHSSYLHLHPSYLHKCKYGECKFTSLDSISRRLDVFISSHILVYNLLIVF